MFRTAAVLLGIVAMAAAGIPMTGLPAPAFTGTPTTELPPGYETPNQAPADPAPLVVQWDAVYDPEGNLVAEDVVDALDPAYLYWKDYYYNSNLRRSDKIQNPTLTNIVGMLFQNTQNVVCMDPAGDYVYNVNGNILRRFNTSDGSYNQYTLSYSGNGACGTDGQYLYVPSGNVIRKYTLTGTYINATTINISTNQYGFAVANDTLWANVSYGTTYNGYAVSRFNGGSISHDATWVVPSGGATPMNIAWDGTYYYWSCGGYSSNLFARFYANRTLYSTGTVYGDIRSVMAVGQSYDYDVGVVAIDSPPSAPEMGIHTPTVRVRNFGTMAQPSSFWVKFWATGPSSYLDSVQCHALAPGAETTLTFSPWEISAKGTFDASCSTMSAADSNRSNDKATKTIVTGRTKVLIAAADLPQYLKELADLLMTEFPDLLVDTMCISSSHGTRVFSPAWAIAEGYRAVLTFSNYAYYQPTWQGDSFAKYMEDGGGGVIWAPFGTGTSMGRFTQYYTPIGTAGTTGSATLGTVHLPGHEIMEDVSTVYMGSYTLATATLIRSTAYKVVSWTNGNILAACNDTLDRRTAVLGFFPTTWKYTSATGDWLQMIRNTFLWAGGRHDVGPSDILVPATVVDSGVTVAPACSTMNFGGYTESYTVRLRIGSSYNETFDVTGHEPGAKAYCTFPNWTAGAPGNISVVVTTELTSDADPSNDTLQQTTLVRKLDVGALSLQVPSGLYVPGDIITPTATWRNYGNSTVDFEAWVILSDPTDAEAYRQKVDIYGLDPGSNMQVGTFPSYQLNTPGAWTVRCSTGLAGDVNPANDVLDAGFTVGAADAGIMAILSPGMFVDTGATVTPSARLRNFSDYPMSFNAWFVISDETDAEVYRHSVAVSGLAGGETRDVVWAEDWPGPHPEGPYVAKCSLAVADDNPANNLLERSFTVGSRPPWDPGWV
ncbi:MAG: hypothetical protein R6X14_06830 [bacterium]